jgi:hypothetical protein
MKNSYRTILILGTISLVIIIYLTYSAFKIREQQAELLRQFKEHETSFNKANESATPAQDSLVSLLGEKRFLAERVMSISGRFRSTTEELKNALQKQGVVMTRGQYNAFYKNLVMTGDSMLALVENKQVRDSIKAECDFAEKDRVIAERYMMQTPFPMQKTVLTKMQNDCMMLDSRILQYLAAGL